jgi:hypothetical protein
VLPRTGGPRDREVVQEAVHAVTRL